jgi:xylose isomerase
MSGAATNPDPDVYAYAAATVKACMDATHRLGGQNYVLWGGREGYETLLNTDLKAERAHAGRFLQQVVEYKHKIGFKGTILIEPKPQEPSKHQYDYDVATVYGFLKDFGLEGGEGQHRTGPRDPCRPFSSSMRSRWRRRWASSGRST